ncbi:hypothetical protein RAZWK3B_03235 [Roseobacter sp. AzwK-3b]|nr:hypothetical protein RAZWK3B_03235 [Roseobacter sp. AzwK-3b]
MGSDLLSCWLGTLRYWTIFKGAYQVRML